MSRIIDEKRPRRAVLQLLQLACWGQRRATVMIYAPGRSFAAASFPGERFNWPPARPTYVRSDDEFYRGALGDLPSLPSRTGIATPADPCRLHVIHLKMNSTRRPLKNIAALAKL
jgi:hypothetical protein